VAENKFNFSPIDSSWSQILTMLFFNLCFFFYPLLF